MLQKAYANVTNAHKHGFSPINKTLLTGNPAPVANIVYHIHARARERIMIIHNVQRTLDASPLNSRSVRRTCFSVNYS